MLAQIGIAVTCTVSIWLVNDPRPQVRRWGCVFGLLGQPFWFYSAYSAAQWGIFAVCLLYTFAWARGFWTQWVRVPHQFPSGG